MHFITGLLRNKTKISYPLGSMSLLQKPIPASYIAVEKAITAISENLKNDMPVLEDSEFR